MKLETTMNLVDLSYLIFLDRLRLSHLDSERVFAHSTGKKKEKIELLHYERF